MKHTVNIAISTNLLIVDDQGHIVQEIILPIWLIFIWLPARLYTWLRLLPSRLSRAWRRLKDYLRGWREDLRLMAQAAALLLQERRFAYA